MAAAPELCTLVHIVYMDGQVLPACERARFFVVRNVAIDASTAATMDALDGLCVDQLDGAGKDAFDALDEWLYWRVQAGDATLTEASALPCLWPGRALGRVVTLYFMAEGVGAEDGAVAAVADKLLACAVSGS